MSFCKIERRNYSKITQSDKKKNERKNHEEQENTKMNINQTICLFLN